MDSKYGVGVRYEDSDYLGLSARIAIVVIDLCVIALMVMPGIFVDDWLYDNYESYDSYYFLYFALVISYVYLTLVKTSSIGTLGQIVTQSRIETINGTKPSLFRMTLRLFFWLFGPLNVITDLVFIAMIKERRSIRDCLCNTIIVRRRAVPVEKDVPIHMARVFALGMYFMYQSCNSKST